MIREAQLKDFERILAIYEYARGFMKETGNPNQWGDTYPPEDVTKEDIIKKRLYVYENEGIIRGVFMFLLGEDPTYGIIEQGQWLSDAPYGTLHRVASDGTEHGFLGKCVEFCLTITPHLRIDTHEENQVMQKAIAKNGFHKCGIIYTHDGSPRFAYERVE